MPGICENSIVVERQSGLVGLAPGLACSEYPPQRDEPLAACFHCGEPCAGERFEKAGKNFCCAGCLTVHELLTEAGLAQFYSLEKHPGTRRRAPAPESRWKYLDEAAVRDRLLDFTDGQTSRVTFHVPGIHCVACVWLLENLFRLHPGVGRSAVNFPRREVSIAFAPDKISLSEVAGLLARIGYEPLLTLGELERPASDPAWKRRWLQIAVAGFAFGNIMLFSIPAYLGLDSFSQPLFRALFGYLSLALALPVLLYSAGDYWRSAFLSIRQRTLTLDVPIALGLAALYLQSTAEIISGRGEGYLDSLAGLVFFLLCGRAFQQKTFERLDFDRDYRCFFPLSVLKKSGHAEITVPLSEVQVGDRLLLRHGELLPADCRLTAGEALIDYSFVTGESEPVAKSRGDRLYAGGKQTGGAIEVEITKPVSQSYLASLWSHETFTKDRQQRLQTLTNRYSRRFTKLVVAVALGSALFWWLAGDSAKGLKAFASVLIVACPCALALAAPFALGTAQRRLARLNIFLKNPLVLERMAEVDTVVFDKTGTLTSGERIRAEFRPIQQPLTGEERQAIGALARHSTHPHSMRIHRVLQASAECLVENFSEVPGCGLEGNVHGKQIQLGSRAWLERCGMAVPEAAKTSESGSWVAIDGRIRGVFVFPAAVRPQTAEMLHDLGRSCQLALLSGDHESNGGDFGALFGPEARLAFNQTPLDKLGFIQRLQEQGRTVLMAGDGLNDAGALRQSDVGIAVVENIGRFSPASDVILEAGRVPEISKLLVLARKSARIVRLSFLLSALYNAAGIGIAAAGLLSPVICAVLMPLSSISVVLFACGGANFAATKMAFSPAPAAASQGDGAVNPQPSTQSS